MTADRGSSVGCPHEPSGECDYCRPVTPSQPRADDLAWWAISGKTLLDSLRRCHAGESPDVVYAELYANSEHEDYQDCPNCFHWKNEHGPHGCTTQTGNWNTGPRDCGCESTFGGAS